MSKEGDLQNEFKLPPHKDDRSDVSLDAAEVDVTQIVSNLNTALVSGSGVPNALSAAEDAYGRIQANAEPLVAAIARSLSEHPELLEMLDTWNFLGGMPRSAFYVAVLQRMQLTPSAQVKLGGYIAKKFPERVGEVEALLNAAQAHYSGEGAGDPEAGRTLSRIGYEKHRIPMVQAQTYLNAVKDLSYGDPHVEILKEQQAAAVAALEEAITLLKRAVQIDYGRGDVRSAQPTANRIIGLRWDGRMISPEDAVREFNQILQQYGSFTYPMGSTDALNLAKDMSNTVDRLRSVYEALGNQQKTQEMKTRFAELRPKN